MKIAFLLNLFPKLSETFILNQITGLIDRGHHVDIFTNQHSDEKIVHTDVNRYNLLDRTFFCVKIPSNRYDRLLTGFKIITKNFRKYPKAIFNSLNVFRYRRHAMSLQLLYKLAPFMNNYDIIHCHFGPNGNWGVTLKELGISGKIVTTYYGYDIRLGIEKGSNIYQRLFDKGDCFIAISEYSYSNLIDFGCDHKKLTLLPTGIDLKKFHFKWQKENSEPTHPVRLLSVGRLVWEKGHKYGIRAIHNLLQKRPDLKIKYSIVGDGPLKEDLNNLVRNLRLEKIVEFLGPQKTHHIIKILSQSHIFLFPSVAEDLPIALMEAQAVGLPVVSTKVGSIKSIVMNERSGFLVPPRDISALTDKLDYLLQHPNKWPEMGIIGKRHVSKSFDINQLNDKLVEIYKKLSIT